MADHHITPAPSPEEAAAVVAAIERFLSDHAPVVSAGPEPVRPWLRTALLEGVERDPGTHPWGA